MHEECVKMLQDSIASEVYAIFLYLHSAYNIKGPEWAPYYEYFKETAETEMSHLGQLSGFLTGYGAPLTLPAITVPSPTNLEEAVNLSIQAEEWAIRDYTLRAAKAEQIGNRPLNVMFENLALAEEEHKQNLLKIAGRVPVFNGESEV